MSHAEARLGFGVWPARSGRRRLIQEMLEKSYTSRVQETPYQAGWVKKNLYQDEEGQAESRTQLCPRCDGK